MAHKKFKIKFSSSQYLIPLFLALFPHLIHGEPNASSPSFPSPSISTQAIGNNPAMKGSLELLTPIDAQLRALREKNIPKAYEESSSEEFKKKTSLDVFTKYIELYPSLSNHQQISIKDQTEHGDKASVNIILDPGQSNVTVQYLLIREKGQWKIWNMEILSGYAPMVNALIKDPLTLNKPVQEFFDLLHEGNIPKAYYSYTSKDFQTTSSLEAFRKFFNDYQGLLSYKSLNLEHNVIDNGVGRLEVVLEGENLMTTLEITLGIVDNQWKVWAINVLKQQPKELEQVTDQLSTGTSTPDVIESDSKKTSESLGPLQFAKIEVGSQVDAKGSIIDPQAILTSLHEDIHVGVYVMNGRQGDRIEVHLKHYSTQSELPTISTTLQQKGNSVVSFSFSPPATGWPKGIYLLEVESATGIKKTFNFTMN